MRRAALLLAFVFSFAAADARAVITGIQITPSTPVIGSAAQITTTRDNTPTPVISYQWLFVVNIAGVGESQVTSAGTNPTIPQFTFAYPGQYTIGVKVTYAPPPMSNLPPAVFKAVVNIASADGAQVIEGLGMAFQINTANLVLDQITSGGTNAGPAIAGEIQESFTGYVILGVDQYDIDWTEGSSPSFNMSQGKVQDYWSWYCGGKIWNPIANGTVVAECDQWLRIEWTFTDSNGENWDLYQTFSNSLHFNTTKFDNTHWMLTN
jgi:hypothetical protein